MQCIRKIILFVGIISVMLPSFAAAESPYPLTVQFHWLANVEFAGILVAKEQGWYEEAGLDVTIKGWEVGIDFVDEVASGRAQIGTQEGIGLIKNRTDGLRFKTIATQFQRSPLCLASKKELGLTTPKALIGKRIGYQEEQGLQVITLMLQHQGISLDQVTLVKIGWELQPVIDDEVDAFIAYMTNQPLILKEQGYEMNIIPAYQYGYDFYSGIYYVQEKLLQDQPEVLRKFLEITLRGWQEAFRDPEETAKMVVSRYYPEGSVTQQTEELKIYQFLATMGVGKQIGLMGDLFWQKGIDILYDMGQIQKKPQVGDLFTTDLLKDIYGLK